MCNQLPEWLHGTAANLGLSGLGRRLGKSVRPIMIINWETLRVFVRPGSTDMRKQINGLAAIVQESLRLDPLDGSLYLFLGKDKRRLKILYWDRNGFCMWQKRLERDRFPWPKDGEAARELTRDQLAMLLAGIDFWNAHQTMIFSQAG